MHFYLDFSALVNSDIAQILVLLIYLQNSSFEIDCDHARIPFFARGMRNATRVHASGKNSRAKTGGKAVQDTSRQHVEIASCAFLYQL